MAFRTVVIESNCKLEYSLNYLVCRTVKEVKRISLDEIQTLIVDSTMVSITSALLNELINKKIDIIFCDEKHNPHSQLVSLYGDSDTSGAVKNQISWDDGIKNDVWKKIIREKIYNQGATLNKFSPSDGDFLIDYIDNVQPGDTTNCEGHCAKYYFNRLFGNNFSRNSNDKINKYLNYGYALLLSQVNRAIIAKGYLTQIGIHHKNVFNQFNLSCDLMEPFRPIIDDKIHYVDENNFKDELVNLFNSEVVIRNTKQTLVNAINIYVNSVLKALDEKDPSLIEFYKSYDL